MEMINNEWVRQLYVPLELRGRLVVAKHGSAAGGHRAAVETLAKLRKLYYVLGLDFEGYECLDRGLRLFTQEGRESKAGWGAVGLETGADRKSTRLNSSHQ